MLAFTTHLQKNGKKNIQSVLFAIISLIILSKRGTMHNGFKKKVDPKRPFSN